MATPFKKTFVIRSPEVISRLSAYLKAQPQEPLLEVVVALHHKNRTLAQNSTMWLWITVIADEWGWEKNEVHKYFKKEHLVKIYERDEEGYAMMLESVRKVHRLGMVDVARTQFAYILKNTSTTSADVKQFTEYLKDIEKEMIGKGFPLPHPSDYWRAMGIKQSKTKETNGI